MRKSQRQPENIHSLTKWVHILAKIFGYWSFSVDNNEKKNANRIVIGVWDLSRAIIMFLLYLFGAYNLVARYDFFKPFNFSRIEIALIQWTMASFDIIAIITICMGLINRKVLWTIISTFNSFDEQVYT